MKVFDYMKSGKLIICSNLRVIREVLINNENSLLVDDFENINSWLDAIRSIKLNEKKFNKIRQNAYNFGNKYNAIWRIKNLLSNINK